MLLAALAARRGTCGDELVDQVGTAWCMGKAVRLRYLTAEQVGGSRRRVAHHDIR